MREQLYARQWVTIESLICAKKPSLLGRFFGGGIISVKRHENSPPRGSSRDLMSQGELFSQRAVSPPVRLAGKPNHEYPSRGTVDRMCLSRGTLAPDVERGLRRPLSC